MTTVLLTEDANGVRLMTLNRPDARNALSSELLDRLVEALHAAEDDPEVRAVVLTGADPAFCAGVDLREGGAAEAHRLGLVNHIVQHEDLLPIALRLAGDITGGDPRTVAALNDTYREVAALPLGQGLALERERFSSWEYNPADIEARRAAIADRGRSQLYS